MAEVKLYLSTSKIWDHFFENFARMQDNEDCIAENKDTKMALYITAQTVYPMLVLYCGEKPILYRLVMNKEECSQYAVYMITKFVSDIPVEGKPVSKSEDKPKIIDLPMSNSAKSDPVSVLADDVEPDEEDEEQKILDTIYEREDELTQAMGDFLAVVLCEEDYSAVKELYGEQFINETVDDFLQYLAEMHNVSIYRPTLAIDPETGEDILKEYPYGWDEDFGSEE